eukprot:357724-Chlamydomonas_euryale.AAC.2
MVLIGSTRGGCGPKRVRNDRAQHCNAPCGTLQRTLDDTVACRCCVSRLRGGCGSGRNLRPHGTSGALRPQLTGTSGGWRLQPHDTSGGWRPQPHDAREAGSELSCCRRGWMCMCGHVAGRPSACMRTAAAAGGGGGGGSPMPNKWSEV